MREDVRELIMAIGAVAEMCGELYRQLIKNGFTEAQALYMTRDYLVTTLTPTKNKEEQ